MFLWKLYNYVLRAHFHVICEQKYALQRLLTRSAAEKKVEEVQQKKKCFNKK